MTPPKDWREELKFIVEFMRDLSRQTDPQIAADLYGRRMRQGGLIPADGFLSVSRRDLTYPAYRITRSSTWKNSINPWTEKHRLPVFNSGLLADLIYSNETTIVENLPDRVSPDDPAIEYFKGMNFLLATPQFDDGESLNMTVVMTRDPKGVVRDRIPMMVMQSNLWGRSVLNSVLRGELKTAYDALDHELKTVGHIQRSLLPQVLPVIKGLDVAADYETSQRAGGDYYDFFPLPSGQWGIFIADVSGHGIPAAVRMAITHAIAHTRPDPAVGPAAILSYLNSTLENRYIGKTGSFVTAFYAIYDPHENRLCYASAGHPPPRLARDGSVISLDGRAGLPLGIDESADYLQHQFTLRSGDRMVFYTDGVSESFNPARDQYGVERLDAVLLKSCGNAQTILNAILADIKLHSAGAAIVDDRTLLVLNVR
ncbi:MAG TPA: PP2C family protein-serine/threonine phosphatase [Tepidisphaeraceae bacterium]|jgi:sigma-B regulation protein RsbU (phosphoserine phosphatase)